MNQGLPSPSELQPLFELFQNGRFAEMERLARTLVARYPRAGIAWKALSISRFNLGMNALEASQKAVELLPADAESWVNFGNSLRANGRPAEAIGQYRRAIAIRPDYAKAHSNLGATLQESGDLEGAVESYRRAQQCNPDFPDAHNNLGVAWTELGEFDLAVSSYERALQLNPRYTEAFSNYLFVQNYRAGQDRASLFAEARRYGSLVSAMATPFTSWDNTPDPGRRLRVGLVSGDLCRHPVGFFIEGLLAAFSNGSGDKPVFIAYATLARSDSFSEKIKVNCEAWRPAYSLSDQALAAQIREDRIDILIDLSGHTAGNRLPAFAWKPAPIQVSWLGYLATTGLDEMNYLIADAWTLPEDEERYFTENIWRLPESYISFPPPDTAVAVSPPPALVNSYVTFGSFNNLSKVGDDVIDAWAAILQAVPQSRLFLKAKQLQQPAPRLRLEQRFAARGVDTHRLILEGPVAGREAHFASFGRVDIALDPFPYPGITSSLECLWMGVPVVSLAGHSFLSRQGLGILSCSGLSDWVAVTPDEYVALAVSHAGDRVRLAQLRARLREHLRVAPVFDGERFAVHFAAALREMWWQWLRRSAGN